MRNEKQERKFENGGEESKVKTLDHEGRGGCNFATTQEFLGENYLWGALDERKGSKTNE